MTAPEGYTVLDFVGFTDRGGYDEAETYMENDLAHYGNTVWKCLVDDTSGVEPSEDAQEWGVFIEGEKPYNGTYATFPRPPLPEDKNKFFVDIETDPRLMYTWSEEKQDYILTGGAGGADGGSVDIPLTLPVAGWTGNVAPYSQTVTVPQMRESMTPLITLTDTDDLTDAQRYAYSLLTDYDTAYAQMTFYAADLPAVDIPVTLKGIPAQEMEFVDNTVVLIVEPSGFALSEDPEYDGRYVSTIPCEGMSAGAEGGSWDIVRSGPVLTLEESKIAASITDVKCLDGAVMIVCTEVPAQRYLLKITGTYKDAAPGDVILPNIQGYLDKVDELTVFYEGEVYDLPESAAVYRNKLRRAGNLCYIDLYVGNLNISTIDEIIGKVPNNFIPNTQNGIMSEFDFAGKSTVAPLSISHDANIYQTYGTGSVTTVVMCGVYLIK